MIHNGTYRDRPVTDVENYGFRFRSIVKDSIKSVTMLGGSPLNPLHLSIVMSIDIRAT